MNTENSEIENKVKDLLRKQYPFLSEKEIDLSWQEYYATQVNCNNLENQGGSVSEVIQEK